MRVSVKITLGDVCVTDESDCKGNVDGCGCDRRG